VDNLAGKTVLGFTQLNVVLGVLLFAPAWTLDFWQAWLIRLCRIMRIHHHIPVEERPETPGATN
jgi:hypothetical protein